MFAFLLAPFIRWIAIGLVVLSLTLAVGYYKHKVNKLEAEVAEQAATIASLALAIEAEREARERAEAVQRMTPEELLEYWKKKKGEQQRDAQPPEDQDEVKKKMRLQCCLAY